MKTCDEIDSMCKACGDPTVLGIDSSTGKEAMYCSNQLCNEFNARWITLEIKRSERLISKISGTSMVLGSAAAACVAELVYLTSGSGFFAGLVFSFTLREFSLWITKTLLRRRERR